MAKSISYKAITFVKGGYSTVRLDVPEIEHNVPENKIVDVNDLHYSSKDFGSSWFSHKYAYIKKDVFESLKDKVLWPTEDFTSSSGEYLGAFVIRTNDNRDILGFLKDKDEFVVIIPIDYLATVEERKKNGYWNERYNITNSLPKRNVKIFLTKEEYIADKDAKKQKSNAKRSADNKKIEALKDSVPCFNLSSPKFKILEIVKETEWIKAGIGDVIHGEIPVIGLKNDNPIGLLKGIGTRTNYINIYVNGELNRTISPLTFQDLFLNNFKVIQVK